MTDTNHKKTDKEFSKEIATENKLNSHSHTKAPQKDKESKDNDNGIMPENEIAEIVTKSETELLNEEIENLKQQLAEKQDNMLRVLAETDNIKKRIQKEYDDIKKYSSGNMVKELLPVFDTFFQALKSLKEIEMPNSNSEQLLKGLELTLEMVEKIFAKNHIAKTAGVNEKFDPHRHQAISSVAAKEGETAGTIQEVLQQGYLLHDRLLRPALVVVRQ